MNYSDNAESVLVYSTNSEKAFLLKQTKKKCKNCRKREKYFTKKTGILMTFGEISL